MAVNSCDRWVAAPATPATPTKRSSKASTSKSSIETSKRGLLTPPVSTPTRSSRHAIVRTPTSVLSGGYHSFQRSDPGSSGQQQDVIFGKGDVVMISSRAKTKGQPWLKVGFGTRQARLQAKAPQTETDGGRVGIIKSFYEENRGEMRCRVHWLADPNFVWQGYDTKETWLSVRCMTAT